MKPVKLLILTFLISAISGCKFKKESEMLQNENQNLSARLAECDSLRTDNLSLIDNVSTTLDSILAANESAVQADPGYDLKTKLNKTVEAITNFIEDNKRNYQSILNKYYGRNTIVKELEGENEKLNHLIAERDSTIETLNGLSKDLNSKIKDQESKLSDLSQRNKVKKDTIDMMTGMINTAYFIAGQEKDLYARNIIIKTGGCLGIFGRTRILNPELTGSGFEKIDIREKNSFTVNTDPKHLEIITPHPAESYEISSTNPGSVEIRVTDTGKFWKFSNYLVIAI